MEEDFLPSIALLLPRILGVVQAFKRHKDAILKTTPTLSVPIPLLQPGPDRIP